MFTLSPMVLFSMTAPAPIVQLSPMVAGPLMMAEGWMMQFLPIFTSSEHWSTCLGIL
jgi:hypothetical protein